MRNRRGLTILVLVLLAFVLIFMGYRATKSSNDPDTSVTQPAGGTESENEKKFFDDSYGTVKVTQWGVKLRMRDAEKITYTIDASPDCSSVQGMCEAFLSITIKENYLQDPDCNDPGATLVRYTTPVDGGTRIGNRYYNGAGGPGVCGDDPNSSDNTLLNRVREDMYNLEEL